MKIKNEQYRNFLDSGVIELITETKLRQALKNIKGSRTKEARALLICLYLSGGRPSEILNLKGKNIFRKDSYIVIQFSGTGKEKGRKMALPRPVYLQSNNRLAKELYDYAMSIMEEMYLFFNFKGNYVRRITKKGITYYRVDTTDKLRYHINKWFSGVIKGSISPYFLRHNRFSKLSAAGVPMQEMKFLKGCRTMESIQPYTHLSTDSAKKIAKSIK